MSNLRRSEQPKSGTYFGKSSLNHNLEQPLPSKATNVEQRIDEVLNKLNTDARNERESCTTRGNWEGYNSKYSKLEAEAKQQLLSLIADIVEEAEPGTYVAVEDTDDLEWQGYVKGVQDYKNNLQAQIKGVSHE